MSIFLYSWRLYESSAANIILSDPHLFACRIFVIYPAGLSRTKVLLQAAAMDKNIVQEFVPANGHLAHR